MSLEIPSPDPGPNPVYRDRRTGLMIFGVFEILLGCFVALMIPLTIFGQVMAAKKHGGDFPTSMLGSTLFTFGVLATGLIWLGIGSFQGRRWARALLLCFGWMGLCLGLVSLVTVIWSLGSMEAIARQSGQELPPGAMAIGKFITVAVVLIFYVVIPGALILFYRSRNVKLTCEHLDPIERWTDRCPLPVIGMCALQVYGAFSLLLLSKYSAAMPIAGFIVTGWTARAISLGLFAFTLYAAWGLYRLSYRTWLLYTCVVMALGISMIVTFARIDLLDYYRTIGLPEWQIKQMAVMPLLQGHRFLWSSSLSFAFLIAYLFYLRRYFVRSGTTGTSTT